MINLLPNTTKTGINYARQNTLLLRACLAVLGVIAGAILIIGAGHFYLASSTARYEKDIGVLRTSLQEQNIDETKQEIQSLSGSVNLVLKVLSKEILFSKLLRQAGAVMPTGSSLSSIEIGDDQKGIDISAGVENYQVGTQVQVNLADPDNKLFEKIDLVSVQCNGTSAENSSQYPCSARLRALFGDNSPYLFINNTVGTP